MKGNIIVGQSGGPTAVINASLAGVYETARERGFQTIYGMLHGIQGFIDGEIVDLSENFKCGLDVELLKRTPSSYLGSCRYKLPSPSLESEIYRGIFQRLQALEVTAFLYIGGNDSMDTIKKLSDYATMIGSNIRFVGVPKTIDNDLAATDHTPGFGSAAKYIGTVTKEIIRDGLVYDMKSVTILEIMGRNAGWLTGASALSRTEDCEGPDLIYLPEVVFDMDAFITRVKVLQEKKKSIVIAVSEGIKVADGRYVCELGTLDSETDAFGHKMLSGTGAYLAHIIKQRIGCKARAIELSTLQRCASHISSRVDVTEAFQVGGAAVKAAVDGETGKMITLKRLSDSPYQCTTDLYDIHQIANEEKVIPREWITEDGTYVNQEFIKYASPLIQGEFQPMFVHGLPAHLHLEV